MTHNSKKESASPANDLAQPEYFLLKDIAGVVAMTFISQCFEQGKTMFIPGEGIALTPKGSTKSSQQENL